MLIVPHSQPSVVCVTVEEKAPSEDMVAGDQKPCSVIGCLMESKESLEDERTPPTVAGDLEGKGSPGVPLPLPSDDQEHCPMIVCDMESEESSKDNKAPLRVAANPEGKESCGPSLTVPSDDNKPCPMLVSDQDVEETSGLLEPLASEDQQSPMVVCEEEGTKGQKLSSSCPSEKEQHAMVVRHKKDEGSHGISVSCPSDKEPSPKFVCDKEDGSHHPPMSFLNGWHNSAADHEWDGRRCSSLGLHRFKNCPSPMAFCDEEGRERRYFPTHCYPDGRHYDIGFNGLAGPSHYHIDTHDPDEQKHRMIHRWSPRNSLECEDSDDGKSHHHMEAHGRWGDGYYSKNCRSHMDIDIPYEQRRHMSPHHPESHFRDHAHRQDERNGGHSFNYDFRKQHHPMVARDPEFGSSCCLLEPMYEKKTYPVGTALSNPRGWICFLNCILQCMAHTVPLVGKLRSADHPDPCSRASNGFCCYCSLKLHVDEAIKLSGNVLYPKKFVRCLDEISPDFEFGRHQDAHEFLRCLLDKLDDASVIPRSSSQPSSSEDGSIVKQIFGGRLKSQLHCPECNHCSDTFEPFLDLNLEVIKMDSIVEALKSFTKVEIIEDFSCEGCKSRVNMEKHLKVEQAPEVLVIQLKRFQNLGDFIYKISDMVEYTLELDLNPFLNSPDNTPLKYDLYGVVEHIGLPSRGHYVCFIRSSQTDWYLFNDEKVSEVSETEVLDNKAYLLFYVKQGSSPWFSTLLVPPLLNSKNSSEQGFAKVTIFCNNEEESTSDDGEDGANFLGRSTEENENGHSLLGLSRKDKNASSSQGSPGKKENGSSSLGLLEKNENKSSSRGSPGKNENGSSSWGLSGTNGKAGCSQGSPGKNEYVSSLQGLSEKNENICLRGSPDNIENSSGLWGLSEKTRGLSNMRGSLQKNENICISLGSPDINENISSLHGLSEKNENMRSQQGSPQKNENSNSMLGSPRNNEDDSSLHGLSPKNESMNSLRRSPEKNENSNSPLGPSVKNENVNITRGPEEIFEKASSPPGSPMKIEACSTSQFNTANCSYPNSAFPKDEIRRSSDHASPCDTEAPSIRRRICTSGLKTVETNANDECRNCNNGINKDDQKERNLVAPVKPRHGQLVQRSARPVAIVPHASRFLGYLRRVARRKRKSKKCRWVTRLRALL